MDIKENFIIVRDYLKSVVDYNTTVIQSNIKELNDIKKITDRKSRQEEFESKLNHNRELMSKNYELMNLYRMLDNYLIYNLNKDEIENIDFFNLTINDVIIFDKTHPLFNDDVFYCKLFDYYKSVENYKMCQYLKKIKK